MKLKELSAKAEQEIVSEAEKDAITAIKVSMRNVTSCKRTLKALEKKHEILLNTEIEDLEDTPDAY